MKHKILIKDLNILYDSVSCDIELISNKPQLTMDQIKAIWYSFSDSCIDRIIQSNKKM